MRLRRVVDDAETAAAWLLAFFGEQPGLLITAVEHRAPEQERHRGDDEKGDERPDDEQSEVAHRRTVLGSTIAPSERIDGTQRPTKMPWSSWPANQSRTERPNETAAATRSSTRDRSSVPARTCDGRFEAPSYPAVVLFVERARTAKRRVRRDTRERR